MRRTQATDCRILPFDVAEVYAALLDCESYPRWWPAPLRVRVLKSTPDRVGSRIEVRPRGGWFTCEVSRIVPDKEILIGYVEGVHRGTGRWTFELAARAFGRGIPESTPAGPAIARLRDSGPRHLSG